MRAQLLLLVAALLLTAAASTPAALLLGMLAAGLLGTACTQGFIAYAAALAPPASRGRIVGTVQAGVMVGLLGARVLSGAVADLGGWRAVYLGSAALMLATLLWLWRRLPAQLPSPAMAGAAWWRQPLALLELLARERTLQVRGTLALLLFVALSILWSALALVLAAPPYGWSHTAIGALGLVGVAGALGAARAGYWADRGHAQRTSGIALVLMTLAWLPLALLPWSLGALLLGILLLDFAAQALHVTNQSLVFASRPDAQSRLVAGYMLFYAVGSGLGGIATTTTYAQAGWPGVCMLGAAVSFAALLFWWATRPVLRPAACPVL
jgi:predicted MFS family arabinose efflux permease